ncbi:MAG: oxidoreductase [Aestuariivirga sp.]
MSKANLGTALVTGASTGIGRATAIALQSAGYRVFGTSRKPVVEAPVGITMLVCDVANDGSVAQMVAEVMKQTGRIDLLVNNAGSGLLGGAEESSIEQIQQLFNVNFLGVVRVTNAVLPIMRKQGMGRIINTSSVLGFLPSPFMAFYAATKHAVEGYSESLDHEVRGQGIRVVLVEPAFTRTSFEGNSTPADQPLAIYDSGRANMTEVAGNAMRTGDAPEVVANVVVMAASAKNPKLRYTAGKTARQLRLLRRFVPSSAFDKSLRKQMNLPV